MRLLEAHEWERLEPIFQEAFGQHAPSLRTTSAVLVEEDERGDIVALLTLQYMPVLEPFWVRPDRRGRAGLRGMWKKMLEHFPQLNILFMHVEDPRALRALELCGAEVMPWTTVRWTKK